jgi:hypothetical protein
VFAPRREHARFCSPDCRVDWNRVQLTDAIAEERALEWSLTGMHDVIERLAVHHPANDAAAFEAVGEAVWWVTIIDARMIRQYMELYDTVLAAYPPAQRAVIEGTLTGLRYVRNQLGEDHRPGRFIEPPAPAGPAETMTADWRWVHRPEPDLTELLVHGQPWELTRYRAYEQWLAGNSMAAVFQRAGDFLDLATGQATATALTGLH